MRGLLLANEETWRLFEKSVSALPQAHVFSRKDPSWGGWQIPQPPQGL